MRDRVSIADPVEWRNRLTTGLYGWWASLPDHRGEYRLPDLARRNHGTLVSGYTWQTAPAGFHAVAHSSSDCYVPDTDYIGTGPYTAACLFRANTVSGVQTLLRNDAGLGGSGNWWILRLNGSAVDWYSAQGGGAITGVGTVEAGRWNLLVGTRDGNGDTATYLNGTSLGTGSGSSGSAGGSGNNTALGSLDGSSEFFDGAIASTAIWTRALLSGDVQDLCREWPVGYPALLRRQGRTQRARVKGFSTPSGTLATGLVGAWELDEASGNAIDSHGSATGTDTNTVGSGAGQLEGSVARDFELSSAEYFSLGDSAALSTGAIDFSIYAEVWMESKPGAIMSIFCKEGFAATNTEYILRYNNSGDRFQFFTGGSNFRGVSANNLGSPKAGQWYSIVAKHDATNNLNYIRVNGGTENSATTSGDEPGDTASGAYIGATNVSGSVVRHWDGKIRRLRFWKKLLTTAEEDELYNSGFGVDYDYINPPVVPSGNRRRRVILCGSR
jgi:hypothetical protein